MRDEEPSPSPPQTHSPMRMFFVDNGEEPLLRVFEDGGPWLVWSMVSLSEGEEWTLPGGLRVTEDGRPSQAELATVPDFRAPPSHVWLIGRHGPCRARVEGPARIAIHYADGEASIAYAMTGCTADSWAPVGIVGDKTQTSKLRWSPATRWSNAALDPAALRLRDEFAAVLESAHDVEDADSIEIELSGTHTTPRVVEVEHAMVWHNPRSCDEMSLRTTLGLQRGNTFDVIPCPHSLDGDCSEFWLLGAIARDDALETVVLMDRLYQVVVMTQGDARQAYQGSGATSTTLETTAVIVEEAASRVPYDPDCDDEL